MGESPVAGCLPAARSLPLNPRHHAILGFLTARLAWRPRLWSRNLVAEVMETTILLTGPVTVYEVGTVRETLRTALADRTAVRIDLSDSGPWDVAGLQLLISCVKSGRERDQSVQLVNAPQVCAEVAERCGLSDWLRSVEG